MFKKIWNWLFPYLMLFGSWVWGRLMTFERFNRMVCFIDIYIYELLWVRPPIDLECRIVYSCYALGFSCFLILWYIFSFTYIVLFLFFSFWFSVFIAYFCVFFKFHGWLDKGRILNRIGFAFLCFGYLALFEKVFGFDGLWFRFYHLVVRTYIKHFTIPMTKFFRIDHNFTRVCVYFCLCVCSIFSVFAFVPSFMSVGLDPIIYIR